jgi:hypothetical protein
LLSSRVHHLRVGILRRCANAAVGRHSIRGSCILGLWVVVGLESILIVLVLLLSRWVLEVLNVWRLGNCSPLGIALCGGCEAVLGLVLLVILQLRVPHPILVPCPTVVGSSSPHVHIRLAISQPGTEMLLGLIHDCLMVLLYLISHR